MALYQTNGVAAAELARENTRLQHVLGENVDGEISVYGKDLATLPSEQARRHWSEYAQRLAKRPVAHIVMVSLGQSVQLVLPLVSVDGTLCIVP